MIKPTPIDSVELKLPAFVETWGRDDTFKVSAETLRELFRICTYGPNRPYETLVVDSHPDADIQLDAQGNIVKIDIAKIMVLGLESFMSRAAQLNSSDTETPS